MCTARFLRILAQTMEEVRKFALVMRVRIAMIANFYVSAYWCTEHSSCYLSRSSQQPCDVSPSSSPFIDKGTEGKM